MKIAIGIDIGGTFTKIILVAENGEALFTQQYPTLSAAGSGQAGIEELLVRNVRDFLTHEMTQAFISERSETSAIAGIGIGVAGFIDRPAGKIMKSPNIPALDGFPITEVFEREFSLPVVVENDANAYAYGEKWLGAGKDIDNFAVLTLGTGLGGGCIYKGELYEGPFEI